MGDYWRYFINFILSSSPSFSPRKNNSCQESMAVGSSEPVKVAKAAPPEPLGIKLFGPVWSSK